MLCVYQISVQSIHVFAGLVIHARMHLFIHLFIHAFMHLLWI